MTLKEKLTTVQRLLVVPKSKTNKFGGFNYRSLEDIQAALKAYEEELKILFILSYDVRLIGTYVYVVATVTAHDLETTETLEASAPARDGIEKKGMDAAQVTGCACSYAAKRAYAGLLNIDDEADVDSMDNRDSGKSDTSSLILRLSSMCEERNIGISDFCAVLYGAKPDKCTGDQLRAAIDRFDAAANKYRERKNAATEEIPMS